MPILEISSRERSALRAAAHPLHAVVLIGDNGLSDAVLKEIDQNLDAHGLIKVRAGGQDRASREEMLQRICDALSCAPVHHLGKVLILYRPESRNPVQTGPVSKERPTRAARKPSEPYTPKKLAAQGKSVGRGRRKPVAEAPGRPSKAPAKAPSRTSPEPASSRPPVARAARAVAASDARRGPKAGESERFGRASTDRPERPTSAGSRTAAARKAAGKAPAPHGIPRRGSALSLRAGARNKASGRGIKGSGR
jgi:RNA-binding protein